MKWREQIEGKWREQIEGVASVDGFKDVGNGRVPTQPKFEMGTHVSDGDAITPNISLTKKVPGRDPNSIA